MSIVAIPEDLKPANEGSSLAPELAGRAQAVHARALLPATPRRRANPQQGRALEIIGHAIEYLVDSRLFITALLDERAEQEAVQILMRCSRAVFAECAEFVPLRHQLGRWLEKRLLRNS